MSRLLAAFAAIALVVPEIASAEPRQVEVSVPAGEAVLAGTLVVPEGKPRAAVVLIQGAGPHGRDQVISGAPMFAELAAGLAEAGVASVRIDNSGVGTSTGRKVAHFKEREPQIAAVLDALAARPEFKDTPIGLVGHSEGTLVATRVWAERNDKVDFLVLLGAPGRPGREVWVEQQSNPDRFPELDAAGQAAVRSAFDAVAQASIAGDKTALEAATDRLFAASKLPAADIAEVRPGFLARMGSAEMQVFLGHDPAAAFARVSDPVLAVWGALDPLTSPVQNVPVFLKARNPASRLTTLVLPDEEHFFLRGEGLKPGEHKRGKMRLSERLVEAVDVWLRNEPLAQVQADAPPVR